MNTPSPGPARREMGGGHFRDVLRGIGASLIKGTRLCLQLDSGLRGNDDKLILAAEDR